MSAVAYCDVYADDVQIAHIEGKCGGCDTLQIPSLIDGIYVACDKNMGKHYLVYPSSISIPEINLIVNSITDGKKLKSKVTTMNDGYIETIDVNSLMEGPIYHETVDNVLIIVHSFIMQSSILT